MTNDVTRRRFLATSATVSAAAVAALQFRTAAAQSPVAARRALGDPDPHDLAARAVDAARTAGASYADVRLTDTQLEAYYNGRALNNNQDRAIGIRVLVDGVWGFQSSATWTPDEAVRLAREAVAQAKANGSGTTGRVELGPPPPTVKGTWVMPVKVDPFTVSLGEKIDYTNYVLGHAGDLMLGASASFIWIQMSRQIKTFASSDGSAWSQTTYLSQGQLGTAYRDDFVHGLRPGSMSYDAWTPAGKGWEMFADAPLTDDLLRLFDEAEQNRHAIPVEVDRCDAVFSAQAMAALLDNTLGAATELDRALVDEANASGTSYLNDPLTMLGTYRVGSPIINVTGNRSLVGGAATVKWDDESVVPDDFTIVKDGVLVDFQTTREQADWLAPYYKKINHPAKSHGCAGSASALTLTMQHAPNLQLMPGTTDMRFDDLVADVNKGIAVMSMDVNMDQQQLTGVGYAQVRKIVNGKLGPYLDGAGIQFRASELWKRLTAVGGAKETRWYGFERGKGQPWQQTTHSVGAVPARINNVDLIDVMRKG
jgi:TldD protein